MSAWDMAQEGLKWLEQAAREPPYVVPGFGNYGVAQAQNALGVSPCTGSVRGICRLGILNAPVGKSL